MENQLKQPTFEQPFLESPTVYRIKLYLHWFAKSRTGQLEDNITDTTVRNTLASLKRAIRLHRSHHYNDIENQELKRFIRQNLVKTGALSTAAKSKPVVPLLVAEDLIQFLWAYDKYQGTGPNTDDFSILLMSSLGTRPREFIESDAWKTINEGLMYDDVSSRISNPEYSGFLLRVRLRNRKGHCDNDKRAYVPFEDCQHVDSTQTTRSPEILL
jgi:hypothetical protein